ncbi:MAG: hypothetical protein ACTSU2_01410 [Promethearchaeota archaeon]
MAITSLVFRDGKWVQADEITDFDSALFISPEEKVLYLWEGRKCSPMNRSIARNQIYSLKDKYAAFVLRKVDDSIPRDTLNEIEKILGRRYDEYVRAKPAFNKFIMVSNYISITNFGMLLFSIIYLILGNNFAYINKGQETLGLGFFIVPGGFWSHKLMVLYVLQFIILILFILSAIFIFVSHLKINGIILTIGAVLSIILPIFIWSEPFTYLVSAEIPGVMDLAFQAELFWTWLLLSIIWLLAELSLVVISFIYSIQFHPKVATVDNAESEKEEDK